MFCSAAVCGPASVLMCSSIFLSRILTLVMPLDLPCVGCNMRSEACPAFVLKGSDTRSITLFMCCDHLCLTMLTTFDLICVLAVCSGTP